MNVLLPGDTASEFGLVTDHFANCACGEKMLGLKWIATQMENLSGSQ